MSTPDLPMRERIAERVRVLSRSSSAGPTLAFIANYAQAVGAELHLSATRKATK